MVRATPVAAPTPVGPAAVAVWRYRRGVVALAAIALPAIGVRRRRTAVTVAKDFEGRSTRWQYIARAGHEIRTCVGIRCVRDTPLR